MGYTLKIGQRVGDTVATERHASAPADGVPTDYTNARWPSYTGWSDFCRNTGLGALMAELMPEHPGIAPIEPRHLAIINAVSKQDLSDHDRARLEWLQYWVNWALSKCDSPAFYND